MNKRLALAAIVGVSLGCSRAPDEPTPPPPVTATPSSESTPALKWTVPPGWRTQKTASRGSYRAKYEVAPVGDDRHPAEVLVRYLGRDAKADLDVAFKRWTSLFEKRIAESESTQTFEVGAVRVRVQECVGTYKYPMGPAIGPSGKSPMQVIKPGWRGIGAGVATPRRGRWWFQIVGPNDTVASARSATYDMLRSLR